MVTIARYVDKNTGSSESTCHVLFHSSAHDIRVEYFNTWEDLKGGVVLFYTKAELQGNKIQKETYWGKVNLVKFLNACLKFTATPYNRITHNCKDFAKEIGKLFILDDLMQDPPQEARTVESYV